jgi:sugar (pentulose or hexulose) kinase
MVRTVETVEPEPATASLYDDGYERFRALYPALSGLQKSTQ